MATRSQSSTQQQRGSDQQQGSDQQRDNLREISQSDDGTIADLIAIRVEEAADASDLDAKTFALVNLGALIGTGGDDASYLLHVTRALDAGASVDEVTAVLTAVGPNVGVFRMVAAADPLATALGINLAAESDQAQSDQQRSDQQRSDQQRSDQGQSGQSSNR